MSTMNRVAIENGMIARRTLQVVLDVRSQGVQQRKRPFSLQPFGTMTLRAACGVRVLVKGMAINFEVFLAPHPAKPLSRPCGT